MHCSKLLYQGHVTFLPSKVDRHMGVTALQLFELAKFGIDI